jgi:hypothetical protein
VAFCFTENTTTATGGMTMTPNKLHWILVPILLPLFVLGWLAGYTWSYFKSGFEEGGKQ